MPEHSSQPNADQLLGVIQALTEVMRQGLDLDWVMAKIVQRSQEIVNATGAVVEIADTSTRKLPHPQGDGAF